MTSQPSPLRSFLALLLAALCVAAGSVVSSSVHSAEVTAGPAASDAAAKAGPTAYPTDEARWPGKGVVRVFGWMVDNRREFWRQRDREQDRVVFAGDSLTAGWRSMKQDFPALPIANRGIGGDVSRGLLFRFQEDVLDLRPRAVVLLIGTNDLTAQQAPSDTVSNIESMITMARRYRSDLPVVVCTVPPSANPQAPVDPAKWKALNAGIASLAGRHAGVSVVDLVGPLSAPDGGFEPRYFAPDRLHLSAEGYGRWKRVLEPVLASNLRLADR